jgi:hypothetical protein
MVTGRNSSSGTVAMEPTGSPAIADIRMACAGSTAIKGSATTQASEAATKTSPMAKTDPLVIERHPRFWYWHECEEPIGSKIVCLSG